MTLSFIVFAFCRFIYAQEAVPFKVQNEFYIYGDAAVIGNNILSKDAKVPFNDTSLTNDNIDMVFVDIDNDPATFSSSTATLKLPENQTKIVYAALYWSATYSYEIGYREESLGQFIFQGKRVSNRDKIAKVKLKLPNGSYKTIKGDVIFDGANTSEFAINSPYVCVADVTKLLRAAKTINGDYTVANVNATQGFVSGGSAAGWVLYVVYKAPTENPQYITTYNGFAHVSNTPLNLKFNNFKTLDKGTVKTALTIAALEGDSAITQDECVLVNPIAKSAALLRTEDRPGHNFFNSKITYSDAVFNDRFPKSENTLGFDIITMPVPKKAKPIIDNSTTEIDIAFNTKSDRFYVFFTAFQTEISKVFYEEKKTVAIAEAKKVLPKKVKTKKVKKPKKPKKITVSKPKTTKPKPEKINAPVLVTKLENTKVPTRSKDVVYTPKTETVHSYKKVEEEKEKPLPIWLKQKQLEVTNTEQTVYQPDLQIKEPTRSNNSLVINRENYEKLLTKEDYIYETQNFKRILNQDATFITGVDKGFYIIANLLYDLDRAIAYQKELQDQGVNSKLFKDVAQGIFYVYLYNSENFYDVFMLRKAFIKSTFLEQVWILKINIEKQVIKKL